MLRGELNPVADTIAAAISGVAPRFPDAILTRALADNRYDQLLCYMPGQGALLKEWIDTTGALDRGQHALLHEALDQAASQVSLRTLRHIRSYPPSELFRFSRLRLGHVVILGAFGTTDHPLRHVPHTIQPLADFL